jgi:hypothetical protein
VESLRVVQDVPDVLGGHRGLGPVVPETLSDRLITGAQRPQTADFGSRAVLEVDLERDQPVRDGVGEGDVFDP